MTHIHFKLNVEELKEKVLGSDLEDVMKSALVVVLNSFMEKERDDYLGAASYERTEGRKDYRNGYYERDYKVPVGTLKLHVPRTRKGEFSPSLFEKYTRSDQSLVLSMLEMVVNGVSTRKVTNIMEALCGEGVSKSMVSNITKKLDPLVMEWANRPLNVKYYPYIYTDAMYIKVREHHKVVSKAVYIAVGVNEEKKREIIGMTVQHAESKESWSRFLESLQSRGLQSPKLVISDAHEGLKQAIQQRFIGTSWQRCTVHFKRNLFDTLPKKGGEEAKRWIKRVFNASSVEEARALKDQFLKAYEDQPRFTKVGEWLEEGFDDAVQFMNEPVDYHVQLRTTNNVERINGEVRRRERVIRIFPNTQSAFRLIGAVLMDIEEQLDRGNRIYLKGT
ncbi:IS256 family transposase [Gracilibacillus phocaeensis]|uniref:IS256 family transposase n=1 Tax=Gracilibacillus phocaeensis TaxID=2042304 RepID=UPI00102F742D|nr:IS256 family transposase [Gracilibacillus phocaeensis]